MTSVIYSMSVSLDGFIAAPDGSIDWAAPGSDLMDFHVEQSRELAAHLCGRKLYENMLPWETSGASRADATAREFARIWSAVPKVVFSTTLETVQGNASLATGTASEELSRLRERGTDGTISVGGATLAAEFVRQDLIDEYRLFVNPVLLGGGTPFFPTRPERLALELTDQRTFDSGVVYLRYLRA